MKIEFVRSGGLAGARLSVVVDTDDLPPPDAARLSHLVEEARAGLTDSPPPGAIPDHFEYRLTFNTPRWGRESYILRETQVPDNAKALVEQLTAMARRSGA